MQLVDRSWNNPAGEVSATNMGCEAGIQSIDLGCKFD